MNPKIQHEALNRFLKKQKHISRLDLGVAFVRILICVSLLFFLLLKQNYSTLLQP